MPVLATVPPVFGKAPYAIIAADPVADGPGTGRIQHLGTGTPPQADNILLGEPPAVVETGGNDSHFRSDAPDELLTG